MKRPIRILLTIALAAITAAAAMNGLARASDTGAAKVNGSIVRIICRIAIGSIGSPYFGALAGGCVWFAVLEFLA